MVNTLRRVRESLTTQQPEDGAAEEELYRREEMLNKFGDKPSFKRSKILAFAHLRQPGSPATIFTKAWVRVPACKGATLAEVQSLRNAMQHADHACMPSTKLSVEIL